jgi:hypothetical protein
MFLIIDYVGEQMSPPCQLSQTISITLPGTGVLVSFYEDDSLPFLIKLFTLFPREDNSVLVTMLLMI